MKIVVNRCFGGFGLSPVAIERLKELGCIGDPDYFNRYKSSLISFRSDPLLIQTLGELGSKANSSYAELEIREIPDDVKIWITEYDGRETIEEQHRSW